MYGASRNQKNILLKPFSGVYGLYGIVSYFSDTLSYSRLLALGLASAIIGVVVNKVAQLAVDMVPYVGWVMLPIIMLGGHVFNLVINALGSFIHSGRLQFVEFFTKFFEGGGKPFKPLTRVSENVSVDAVD
jgi:V/A-type H+-transporting ATPase subunit I